MHIERAYSVELRRVVSIYDARDYYFRQTPPRKRFKFLCSDEKCRETNKTKVTGVNYDKLVEESDQYVKPHFRENTEHISDCEWVELEIALNELKEESGSDFGHKDDTRRPRRGKNLKSSDMIDIFVPSSTGGARAVERLPVERREEIKRIPNQRDRIKALKKTLKENPNQTSLLENVVDCYLTLGPDERRQTHLKIGKNRWRSYRECFRPIRFYNRGGGEAFIYYGGTKARRFGHNFSLIFFDKVEFEGGERWISLYIKKERLDRYKHRAYLSEFLEKLASGGARYATCYFYGRIWPSTNNAAFLDVEVAHFNNLVLRLK